MAEIFQKNMGRFKVPTLRNVDKRPHPAFVKSYMHNGYFTSLEAVVSFYNTRDVKSDLSKCLYPRGRGLGARMLAGARDAANRQSRRTGQAEPDGGRGEGVGCLHENSERWIYPHCALKRSNLPLRSGSSLGHRSLRSRVDLDQLVRRISKYLWRLTFTKDTPSVMAMNAALGAGLWVRKTGGRPMISRRSILLTLAVATISGGSWPVFAGSRQRTPIQMFDTDNDGTLDLAEVKRAASALFARLDRDHDGTLDKRELAGRLSPKEFDAADQDHDGTLKSERVPRCRRAALQCGKSGQGRHLGCQGIKHQRRAGTLEITQVGVDNSSKHRRR